MRIGKTNLFRLSTLATAAAVLLFAPVLAGAQDDTDLQFAARSSCQNAAIEKLRAAHNDAEGIVFDEPAISGGDPIVVSGTGHYASFKGESSFSFRCSYNPSRKSATDVTVDDLIADK